ncbi:CotH kinase family protein [Eubacterium sp. MSJ-21]|nr:CotH kinase family protein [Eubacterium sp. MSJ-21]
MVTSRHIDKICCIILIFTILLTVVFCNAESLGVNKLPVTMGYEKKLFDTSKVHTIDIVMDDWDSFIEGCEDEEYVSCAVVIDNEAYKNIAIRAKGNTSLSSVAAYGNDRYSFKLEFDHYDSGKTYHGLDKLSLNNIIQDNTYMKDYLCYQMMGYMGVDAPLCSYVWITVNGEAWGLYLAVEGVEDSFLERNYGTSYGELYKPDSQSMGGGRGNGADISETELAEQFFGDDTASNSDAAADEQKMDPPTGTASDGQKMQRSDGDMGDKQGGPGGMGSDDVSLIYSDDEYSSYSNIFNNTKTDITDEDKDRLIASLKSLNENSDIEDVVNVDEVIRYFVVHNFVCNFDSYTGSMIHNYYLYEEDGQLSMIPWDYNLAFGGFSVGGGDSGSATQMVNYPIDTPVSGGTVDSRPMLAWIFADESYTELYHSYFDTFISEYFESGYFENLITQTENLIASYVERDPAKFCTYEAFETGVDTLRSFCLLRAESIRGQLDGTIPSTSDGQQADDTTLVDASSISLTDMGSMGQGGGQMPGGGERPDMPDGGGQMPGGGERPSGGSAPTRPDDNNGSIPGGGSPPEKPEGAETFHEHSVSE